MHVYLFGDMDNPIEFPDVPSYINSTQEPSDSSKPENEEDIFVDEDVFDDDEEEELSINPTIPNGCKSRWGEDSIFRASGCISGQSGAFTGIECGDPLYQANCPNRDQILLVGTLGIVFLEELMLAGRD